MSRGYRSEAARLAGAGSYTCTCVRVQHGSPERARTHVHVYMCSTARTESAYGVDAGSDCWPAKSGNDRWTRRPLSPRSLSPDRILSALGVCRRASLREPPSIVAELLRSTCVPLPAGDEPPLSLRSVDDAFRSRVTVIHCPSPARVHTHRTNTYTVTLTVVDPRPARGALPERS